MAGYKLSKSAVTKTARTVRNYGTDPKRKTPQQSRRIGGPRGGGGDTNVYPCIVTTVSETAVYAVKLVNPSGTPFLVAPLSYQDTNLAEGNVIMATQYTAVTL